MFCFNFPVNNLNEQCFSTTTNHQVISANTFLNNIAIVIAMCFHSEFSELEKAQLKPVKLKRDVEIEEAEENPIPATA
jgi:hypothetical protein